jgi:hypothetical protein
VNSVYSWEKKTGAISEVPPRTQPLEKQLETFASAGAAAQRAADEVIKKQIESKIEAVAEATSTEVTPVPDVREKWLKYPLINATAVREFLLEHAGKTRAKKFTRVSEDTLIAANAALRYWLISHVQRMPSKGKTL